MKNFITILFITSSALLLAQRNATPKEAAETLPGYYVNIKKGDTVKVPVRINPMNEYDFYSFFEIADPRKGGKLVKYDTKKVKAYGWEDNDFTVATIDGKPVFVKYLAQGRLNFVEYKYPDKLGGKDITGVDYYIQDSQADDEKKELREFKKLRDKFYKKDLEPYMAQQQMIWNDLDKFNFKPNVVANSIREYNKMYEQAPPAKDEPVVDDGGFWGN